MQLRQSSLTSQQTTLRDLKTKLDALKTAAADLRSPTTWSESPVGRELGPHARRGRAHRRRADRRLLRQGHPARGVGPEDLRLDAERVGVAADDRRDHVDIPANATIADVATTINGRADLPVYAAVVGGDKLVLSSRATGAAATFSATGAQLGAPTNEVAGRNAKYLLDGDVTERESATNVVEDAIPGLRLTLKGTTATPRASSSARPASTATRSRPRSRRSSTRTTRSSPRRGPRPPRSRSRTRRRRRTTTRARSSATPASARCCRGCAPGMGVAYGAIGNAGSLDELRDIGISTGKAGAVERRRPRPGC